LTQHDTHPPSVIEQELGRKIEENGMLHSKIFDLEHENEVTLKTLTLRIDELVQENGRLMGIKNHHSILSPPASIAGSSSTWLFLSPNYYI
jgi:hypothetical protein